METLERELFDYRDGKLYWKVIPNNSVVFGQEAGWLNDKGYRLVRIGGKNKRLHRVIWAYHYGEIEEGVFIDHINRDPLDNRIENLRLCDRSQNQGNSKLRKDNKLGLKGVRTRGNKFRAAINKKGKYISLGSFDTAKEAHAAYLKAAEMYFGEFACGG
jgi:hypothetical protein